MSNTQKRTLCRWHSTLLALAFTGLCLHATTGFAQEATSQRISVDGPHFAVKDSAEIPALEPGRIQRLTVTPGNPVRAGQELGTLNDQEAALAVTLAGLDVNAARRKFDESQQVEIAEAALKEATELLSQIRQEASIAKAVASDDSAIRLAESEERLAFQNLELARNSRSISSISISDQEWFRLNNLHEQKKIGVEAARLNQSIAAQKATAKQYLVQQQQSVVDRLTLQLQQTRTDRELDQLEIEALETTLKIAEARLLRRRLTTPVDGLVVEQKRKVGEWVEAGQPIVRVIRLSQLYVEGFADAQGTANLPHGTLVEVIVDGGRSRKLPGRLVFVSPEVDSKGQVLVRAEIDNPDLLMRPGERTEMWIVPGSRLTGSSRPERIASPLSDRR